MASQRYINLPPPAGFPLPQLVFFRVRPEDVQPPPNCPLTPTQFKHNRRDAIYSMDLKIWEAFSARMTLIEALSGNSFYFKERQMELFTGLDQFEAKWKLITSNGGNNGRAAAIIARAALFTTKELQEFGMDENFLHCAYGVDSQSNRDKGVLWPTLGTLFPELSPWLLAPINSEDKSVEVVKLIKRECPDITSRGGSFDNIAVNDQSWDIYMEHGRLITTCGGRNENADKSKKMLIGNARDVVELSSNVILSGAVRMFTISTFLTKIVELSFQDYCSECYNPGEDLKLKRCTRCLSSFYCGKECQTVNFKKSHKKECKLLKELQSWYDSETPLPEHDQLGVFMAVETFLYPDLRDAILSDLKDAVNEKMNENRSRRGNAFGSNMHGYTFPPLPNSGRNPTPSSLK